MESFDHSTITSSIYSAQTIPLADYFSDILGIQNYYRPSFLQDLRFVDRLRDYAFAPANFLGKIASNALLPNVSRDKVEEIVKSDKFNVKVWIKSINPKSEEAKKAEPFLLTSSSLFHSEVGRDEYVLLPERWFRKKKVPYYDNAVISVDADDVRLWKNYEDTMKKSVNVGGIVDRLIRFF